MAQVVGLVFAAPAVGFGAGSRRRISYLLAILTGGATAAVPIRNFVFAARAAVNIGPDPVGTNLFQRIDARLVWFNPLLIAEPLFVALFFVATALWLIRTARYCPRKGLTTGNQFLIVCFSIVICGVGASIIRSVPTHHHLAAYAPAAWLIIGTFYARLTSWLRPRADIRSLPFLRKIALLVLCATTMFTLLSFPLTYVYERIPRSESLDLVRELRNIAGENAMLVAVPDALSPLP